MQNEHPSHTEHTPDAPPRDDFGRHLKQQAEAFRPEFSLDLHSRIMAGVETQARRAELWQQRLQSVRRVLVPAVAASFLMASTWIFLAAPGPQLAQGDAAEDAQPVEAEPPISPAAPVSLAVANPSDDPLAALAHDSNWVARQVLQNVEPLYSLTEFSE